MAKGYVVEKTMDCIRKLDGKPIHVNICEVVELNEDGEIVRINEYADSARSARGDLRPWEFYD